MKKVLLLLIVVGVLLMGTFAIAEEFAESSDEIGNFPEGDSERTYGDPIPCGGGGGDGGGPGGLPG